VVTPAAQPAAGGTTVGLETGDNRIVSASAAGNPFGPTGGSLWFAYNEECDNSTNSCFHLVQLRSETRTIGGTDKTVGTDFPRFTRTMYRLNQDFQVTASPNDVFYPALDVDRDQNLALIFGFSGSSQSPSLAVSRQDYNPGLPPSNSIQPPVTVVLGTSSDITSGGACTSACSRYGDYFGAAANPVERNWWLAGEWMTTGPSGNAIYSTWIVPFFVRP
jgi:hypothetical protein